MTIEAVVDYAREMQERSGVRFDLDGVRDSVEHITRVVGVHLNESDAIKACDAVLQQQAELFPVYAGLPVLSINGEVDTDGDGQDRFTGEGAIGVLAERDDANGQWCAHFTNGTTVWITDEELFDTGMYELRRHDDLSFLSAKRPDGRYWGSENNSWSAAMTLKGTPPDCPGLLYSVNLDAKAGADYESDNVGSNDHGLIEIGYSVFVGPNGDTEIAYGTLAHEGDRSNLMGHLSAHARDILDDVFEAMRHPNVELTAAKRNSVGASMKAHQREQDAIAQCDDVLAKAGLPTVSELMASVTQARESLLEMVTAPATNAQRIREAKTRAWSALHGCILSDERKAVLAVAQEMAQDMDMEPIRTYEDAVRKFGFGLLKEHGIKHPRLRELVGGPGEPQSVPKARTQVAPASGTAASADASRTQLIQAIGAVATAFKQWKEQPSATTGSLVGQSILELRKSARKAGLKSTRFNVLGDELGQHKPVAGLLPHDLADSVNRVLDADMVAASNGGGAFTRHVVPELNMLESLAIGHGIVRFVSSAPADANAPRVEAMATRPRVR